MFEKHSELEPVKSAENQNNGPSRNILNIVIFT